MLKINTKESQLIFQELSREYTVVAPVEKIGKGNFSNTNLLTYDKVESFEEIIFSEKTYFSAKSVLFPVRQSLFRFSDDLVEQVREDMPAAVIFLRACDINAISVMDRHFLENGGNEDPYYKRRREATKFFLMECERPFDNCFCVSMGTNKTEDYSVFMRKIDRGYEIEINDEGFRKYFSQGEKIEGKPRFVEKDLNPIHIPQDISDSIFQSDIWQEYSSRCIACGRCNTSCPTCSCFSIQDIASEEEKNTYQRKRIWSSCQVKNFSLLAGNHDFRIKYGDRTRYKVLHKISDFKKRTGFNMCVGCGRCDDVCPEYISMFNCVEKINKINALGENNA